MPIIFLDTSALLKLYIAEKGSAWLENFVAGGQIVISELALYETANVLRRRYVDGEFSRDEAIDLFGQINRATQSYEVMPLGGQDQLGRLLDMIFNLSTAVRVRSLDSIHLTAAVLAYEDANSLTPPEPFVFISADAQLLKVAQARGLPTDNPENHLETDQNQPSN